MTATTTTRLDLDFVVMTADFVVWSKILVEVTVNRVCTTAACYNKFSSLQPSAIALCGPLTVPIERVVVQSYENKIYEKNNGCE